MSGPTRDRDPERDRFEELAAAYALGALTSEDRLWFEAYLAEHPELNAEVDELGSVADLLALAPADQEPPPGLRRSVLEGVGAPPEVARGAPARRLRRVDSTRRLLRPATLAAAAALVAVLGLLFWNLTLQDQNGDLRARNGDLQGEVAERRAVDLEGSGLASGTDGEVLLTDEGQAVLVAKGLPPAPEGEVYEAWLVRDGVPEPAGLFEPRNGAAAAAVEGSLEGVQAVAVTLEPEGGSPMPTSDVILQAPLA